MELKTLLDDSLKEKEQILAISIDTHEHSKALIAELEEKPPGQELLGGMPEGELPSKVDFPLLEDQKHRVIDRYGLLNPKGRGWPHPATYVIDREGMVRWKFVEVDFKVRPTNDMVLDSLKTLPWGSFSSNYTCWLSSGSAYTAVTLRSFLWQEGAGRYA